MLTFLPLEQIDEMDRRESGRLNEAKIILADELTALVHGTDEAKKAGAGAVILPAGGAASMPDMRDRPKRRKNEGKNKDSLAA